MKKLTLIQLALCVIGLSLVSLIPGAFTPVQYHFEAQHFLLSLACSLPMLFFGYFFLSSKGQSIPQFREIFKIISESKMGSAIESGTWVWFFLISLIAGVFEELIFRGVLQNQIGLVATSILFGLVHFVNWTYFFVTTLIGFYLGIIYHFSEVNLFIPTVVHFLYDFILLLWFQKKILRSPSVDL